VTNGWSIYPADDLATPERMAGRKLAIGFSSRSLFFAISHGSEPKEGKEAGPLLPGIATRLRACRDWPTYNCHVLGWRYNADETGLSKANVGRW